ncbi:MAG TPA: radical SAM protein [Thermodesulfobacteriota bacterium]
MSLPRYVQIEPVGQCNLRCRMCPIQFRRDGPPYGPPAYMPFDAFTRLLDGFDGMSELHLQGLGEPMMHPRFFDMVAYAARRGITVTTSSNLTLLTETRAARCVTSGLARLHVSIDGATAGTYEAIRLRGRFDRVVRNVERIVAARRRLGAATPRLRLVMVLVRRNLPELPDVVRLARRLEIDDVFVQHLSHDFGESSLPAHYRPMRDFVERETVLGEDPARVERFFAEAREVAESLGVELRLPRTAPRPHPPGTPGRARCDWPFTGAYVSYDGLAMPCCMVATPDRIHFGSMVTEGVRAVWEGPAYGAFRARLESDDPPEVCRTCSLYAGTF